MLMLSFAIAGAVAGRAEPLAQLQVPMQLPFAPRQAWKVTFGWGQNTHVNGAKFCWDFVLADGPSRGVPLYAAAPGKVVQVVQSSPSGPLPENVSGNFIDIEQAPGEISSYNHILQSSSLVKEGDFVQAGQQIALTGDTGASDGVNTAATGNDHLHFTLGNGKSGESGATTINSAFADYEVSTDAGKTWKPVALGVPEQGQWIRRWPLWWPETLEWADIGGTMASSPVALAWGPGRLDVFARGQDGRVYNKVWEQFRGGWWPSQTEWKDLGGAMADSPVAVAWAPGHIDLVARGKDGHVYNKVWDQSTGAWWPGQTEWADMGGTMASSPVAVVWGPGRLDVFARGQDGRVYNKVWEQSRGGWWPGQTEWKDLGGAMADSPSAVAWGPGHIDLVARGKDGHVYNKVWDQSTGAWWPGQTEWADIGGTMASSPVVRTWGPGRLDVFARGQDGRVYNKVWEQSRGGWWPSQTEWADVGGTMADSPVAVTWGPGRMDLFARGQDGRVYNKVWEQSRGGWWPSQTGWADLGGGVTDSPAAVAWGPGHLDLVARGKDGHLYNKVWQLAH
jgi:murein DD-endopeptidase MepM/ murein hydrolase activator NlpD